MLSRRQDNPELSIRRFIPAELKGNRNFYFFVLLAFNLIYYFICITVFPVFSSDDFYLVYRTSFDSESFSLFSADIFFLNVRPVFYFSSAYHLLGDPFLMKLLSLGLHLICITIIYYLFAEMPDLANRKPDLLPAFLAAMFFSVHPDTLLYIIHLNNATGLLMMLFYTAAVFALMKYASAEEGKGIYLTFFTVFFLMSAFSKQTGIHLPFLVLYALFCLILLNWKKCVNEPASGGAGSLNRIWYSMRILCGAGEGETGTARKNKIFAASARMAVFTAGFTYVNIVLYGTGIGEAGTVLNKLFTIPGTLLFVLTPFIAEKIYGFFLFNKDAAFVTIFCFACILFGYFIKYKNLKKALLGTGFLIILFFPRFSALGGGRINAHLVFWSSVLFCYLLTVYSNQFIYTLFTIYLFSIFFYSYSVLLKTIEVQNIRDHQITELKSILIPVEGKDYFVALSSMSAFNYEYVYKTQGFIEGKKIKWQPLISKYLFPGMEKKEKIINCERRGENLFFKALKPEVYIGENPLNRIHKKYKVKPLGQLNREYYEYSIIIPKDIKNIIFHNGLSWEPVL